VSHFSDNSDSHRLLFQSSSLSDHFNDRLNSCCTQTKGKDFQLEVSMRDWTPFLFRRSGLIPLIQKRRHGVSRVPHPGKDYSARRVCVQPAIS